MRTETSSSPRTPAVSGRAESLSSPEQEVDYSPRERTFKEQMVFGMKVGAVAAAFFLIIFLYENAFLK